MATENKFLELCLLRNSKSMPKEQFMSLLTYKLVVINMRHTHSRVCVCVCVCVCGCVRAIFVIKSIEVEHQYGHFQFFFACRATIETEDELTYALLH